MHCNLSRPTSSLSFWALITRRIIHQPIHSTVPHPLWTRSRPSYRISTQSAVRRWVINYLANFPRPFIAGTIIPTPQRCMDRTAWNLERTGELSDFQYIVSFQKPEQVKFDREKHWYESLHSPCKTSGRYGRHVWVKNTFGYGRISGIHLMEVAAQPGKRLEA